MRFRFACALLLTGLASPLQAGVFTDDLSRCLVTKASEADRAALMAWMFSAIGSDPRLQKYTTLDRAKRDKIAADAAGVFQHLMVVDCRKEAVAALKADGEDSIQDAFGQLGQTTTHELFQSPEAQRELDSLGKNFDEEKMKALGREAGIAVKDDDEKK
jgi:hypothetical protein